jgi:hypothetical protein
MINSISTIEQYKKNAFENVTQRQTPEAYWLDMPKTQNAAPQEEENDSFISNMKILTPEEARKTHNVAKIGISIAAATIFAAGATYFLLKGGGSRGLVKHFEKAKLSLERKLQTAKLDPQAMTSTSNKLNLLMLKFTNYVLDKTQAINNFTSLKDILFKRFMNLIKGGGKIHDKITDFFEKLGLKTIKSAYKSTSEQVHGVNALTRKKYFEMLNRCDAGEIIEINGVSKTKAAWFMDIQRLNSEMVKSYDKTFSPDARNGRYCNYKKLAEELKAEFSDLKVFWSQDFWKKFIADSKIMEGKIAIQNSVKAGRRELSYSILDMAKESDDIVMSMAEKIMATDAEKIMALGNIRANILKYAKNPEKNPILRKQIQQDLGKFIIELKKTGNGAKYSDEVLEQLSSDASKLLNTFNDFKQGKVEDILTIYKNILPKKDFGEVERAYKSGMKSLDSAIRVETDDFASKLRDLTLGSAPTDILSLVGGLAVLGYNLAKADNNDQRTSITLKYGIPAIATIGVSLYCNAKMLAGTKGMIAATVSSLILNRIGTTADELLKKYKAKNAENPPKTV